MGTVTRIRIADRNDIKGIVELQKHIYPEYNRDAPFFVWQCFENANPSILVVAQENTSVVGTFGIQKIRTTTGLYGGQISWIIIAQHKRGSGLFARMSQLALESIQGLDFIFIFANKEAVLPCKKRLGMAFIGELSQLVAKPGPAGDCTDTSVETVSNATRFDKLFCSAGTVTFERTERYRRWRYANSTVYTYFKVSVPSGEYAVIKLFEDRHSSQVKGDIVDFECDLLDSLKLQSLFHAASLELGKMGATTITTWAVPGSNVQSLLEEMGFVKSDHRTFFGARIFNQEHGRLCDLGAWHLVQSDASNY